MHKKMTKDINDYLDYLKANDKKRYRQAEKELRKTMLKIKDTWLTKSLRRVV